MSGPDLEFPAKLHLFEGLGCLWRSRWCEVMEAFRQALLVLGSMTVAYSLYPRGSIHQGFRQTPARDPIEAMGMQRMYESLEDRDPWRQWHGILCRQQHAVDSIKVFRGRRPLLD